MLNKNPKSKNKKVNTKDNKPKRNVERSLISEQKKAKNIPHNFRTKLEGTILQFTNPPAEKYAQPVDTSVITLAKYNNAQNFNPSYSGDIMDMSNKSLQHIKAVADDVAQTVTGLKNRFEIDKKIVKEQLKSKASKAVSQDVQPPKDSE